MGSDRAPAGTVTGFHGFDGFRERTDLIELDEQGVRGVFLDRLADADLVVNPDAGIPPLVGFQAKLSVLQALVSTGQTLYIGLAVFAVLMSLIGAFYYLRVVKVMYFDAPITATTVSAGTDVRAVLSLNGALVLILGIVPGGLMALCASAIVKMLGA